MVGRPKMDFLISTKGGPFGSAGGRMSEKERRRGVRSPPPVLIHYLRFFLSICPYKNFQIVLITPLKLFSSLHHNLHHVFTCLIFSNLHRYFSSKIKPLSGNFLCGFFILQQLIACFAFSKFS